MLSAALVLLAAACLAVGLRSHDHPLAGPVGPERPPPAAVVPGSALTTPLSVAAHSVPVSLDIPAIGLSVPLSQLGLNADGTVEVPTDVQQPGWFDQGPSPGQLGAAVILGHVDSYQGPGVFFALRTLLEGDQVNVTLADGTVAHFAVYTVVQYDKTGFPAALVYDPRATARCSSSPAAVCSTARPGTTSRTSSSTRRSSRSASPHQPPTPTRVLRRPWGATDPMQCV